MSNMPKMVPLPEVAQYTDRIQFQSLGLPIGFDDERLLVNVNAIERIARFSGLGEITVQAAYASEDIFSSINNVDGAGTATLSSFSKIFAPERQGEANPEKLHEDFDPDLPIHRFIQKAANHAVHTFIHRDTTVTLDLSQRDDLLRESVCGKRNAFNPALHARFLSGALRTGLIDANKKVNVSGPALVYGAGVYGSLSGTIGLIEHSLFGNVDVVPIGVSCLAVRPLIELVMARRDAKNHGITNERANDNDMKHFLNIRHSILLGATLDRYAMGKIALATTGKLIIANK